MRRLSEGTTLSARGVRRDHHDLHAALEPQNLGGVFLRVEACLVGENTDPRQNLLTLVFDV
jgi:hypothetical protein